MQVFILLNFFWCFHAICVHCECIKFLSLFSLFFFNKKFLNDNLTWNIGMKKPELITLSLDFPIIHALVVLQQQRFTNPFYCSQGSFWSLIWTIRIRRKVITKVQSKMRRSYIWEIRNWIDVGVTMAISILLQSQETAAAKKGGESHKEKQNNQSVLNSSSALLFKTIKCWIVEMEDNLAVGYL